MTVNTPNLTLIANLARLSAATVKSSIQEEDCQYDSPNRWLASGIKCRLADALAVLCGVQGRLQSQEVTNRQIVALVTAKLLREPRFCMIYLVTVVPNWLCCTDQNLDNRLRHTVFCFSRLLRLAS